MLTYLRDAADYIAETLEGALEATGVAVYRCTAPGYAQLTTPCVAVDAPTVDDWQATLSAAPIASLTVPLRVIPRSSDAGGQLIDIADRVLEALHFDSELTLVGCLPTIATGQGLASPMPAYSLSVSVSARYVPNGG